MFAIKEEKSTTEEFTFFEELKQEFDERLFNYMFNKGVIDKSFSVKENCYRIEEFLLENTSQNLFMGDVVILYPAIKERRTNKSGVCHLCGSLIKNGQTCACYRPMLYNVNAGVSYILDLNLRVGLSCSDNLPVNIQELETLITQVEVGYDRDDLDLTEINKHTKGFKVKKLENIKR